MTQLTQQTKNQLKKYLKPKSQKFWRDLKLFKSFQSSIIFIKLAYIILLVLSKIIHWDADIVTEEVTYFNYHKQTYPPKKEQKFHLSFTLIEVAGFYLICNAFSQYHCLAEKKRKIFTSGLLLIVFTSFLLSFNNFDELTFIIFKALAIVIFTIVFIQSTQIITSKESYIPLFMAYIAWIFFCFSFSKNLKAPKQKQIFTASIYLIILYTTIFVSQLTTAIKYYWRVQKQDNLAKKIESVYHMKSNYFFVIINLCISSKFFLIDSNEVRISQYPDISWHLYFKLAWILHETVIFILVLLAVRNIQLKIQRQIYRYLISGSLLSPNQRLLKSYSTIPIGQCYICLSEPVRFAYQSCGHLYCGNNCVKVCLEQSQKLCPICRKPSNFLCEIRIVEEENDKNRKFEIINKYQLSKF